MTRGPNILCARLISGKSQQLVLDVGHRRLTQQLRGACGGMKEARFRRGTHLGQEGVIKAGRTVRGCWRVGKSTDGSKASSEPAWLKSILDGQSRPADNAWGQNGAGPDNKQRAYCANGRKRVAEVAASAAWSSHTYGHHRHRPFFPASFRSNAIAVSTAALILPPWRRQISSGGIGPTGFSFSSLLLVDHASNCRNCFVGSGCFGPETGFRPKSPLLLAHVANVANVRDE